MKDSQIDFIIAKSAMKKIDENTYRFKCKDLILFRSLLLDIVAESLDSAKEKLKQQYPSFIIESYEEI